MTDALSMATGAGLLTVGSLIGWLVGYLSGRRAERRRRAQPQEPICGCGHHLARHDRQAGTCHTSWLVDRKENNAGRYRSWEEPVQCSCRQYVGPEPISQVWVPPVAVENGNSQ